MANTETPMVARVHFDDLAQQFSLHISFQLDTPLGNFRREFKVDVGTLAEVIALINQYWPQGALGPDGELPAWAGDMSGLATTLTAQYPAT